MALLISLTVKDIKASKAFYEKLNFTVFGGELDQKWIIMENGDCKIGLFQGMFDKNMLHVQYVSGLQREYMES